MVKFESAVMHFLNFDSEEFLKALGLHILASAPTLSLYARGERRARLVNLCRERFGDGLRVEEFNPQGPLKPNRIFVIYEDDPKLLSGLLHYFIDRPAIVFASITKRYLCGEGLVTITIPKAGTHLLFNLLSEFRLHHAGPFVGQAEPHTWYSAGGNSHKNAAEMFTDLGRSERGGYEHLFFKTPAILMYRHPLDMLASELSYFERRDSSALCHYFRQLPADRKIDEAIDGALLGEFWRRVVDYSPYLDLQNVIPLCFEELIGPKGGGSLEAQLSAIWSLQIKLHIPGNPRFYGEVAFSEDSPTFFRAQIGRHVDVFSPAHRERIRRMPQDFFHRFGYSLDDLPYSGYLPRRTNEFRTRILSLSPPSPLAELVVSSNCDKDDSEATHNAVFRYGGYLIGEHSGRWFGAPLGWCPFDPDNARSIPHFYAARSMDQLMALLSGDVLDSSDEFRPIGGVEGLQHIFSSYLPRLVEEGYKGFNIIKIGDMFLLDWHAGVNGGEFGKRYESIEAAKAYIDGGAIRIDDATPKLIRGGVNGKNVVLFKGHYFCVPLGVQLEISDYMSFLDGASGIATIHLTMAAAISAASADP